MKFKKNEEIDWSFNVKYKNEIVEGQMLGNYGRKCPK